MKFTKESTVIYQESLMWVLYSSLILPITLSLMIAVHETIIYLHSGIHSDRALMGGLVIFAFSGVVIASFIVLWVIPSIFLYTVVLSFFPSLASTPTRFILSISLIYLSLVLATYQLIFEGGLPIIFENLPKQRLGQSILLYFLILVFPRLCLRLKQGWSQSRRGV